VRTITDLIVASARDAQHATREVARVATLMGFGDNDTNRIAVATSEVIRATLAHGGQSRVKVLGILAQPRWLWIHVGAIHLGVVAADSDTDEDPLGPGLGISAARQLMTVCEVAQHGPELFVRMARVLPPDRPTPPPVEALKSGLADMPPEDPYESLQRQNQTLRLVLRELDEKQAALTLSETGLKRALLAREDILRIVSHDLRNPLGLVKMSASLLPRLTVDTPSQERVQRVVDTVEGAVVRMERIISDLLDVAALDRGTLAIQVAPRDGAQVVRETCENVAAHAQAAGITLVARADQEVRLVCDAARLVQMLSNIVSNAIKFSPPESEVVVSLTASHTHATFKVTDRGPGIPADQRARIFEPYWQLDPNDNRGIGLGLAITAGIVAAHGGTFVVDDGPEGVGTTMAVTLPRYRSLSSHNANEA